MLGTRNSATAGPERLPIGASKKPFLNAEGTWLGLNALEQVFADLEEVVAKTCRRKKRSKPGTPELLNDVTRPQFS